MENQERRPSKKNSIRDNKGFPYKSKRPFEYKHRTCKKCEKIFISDRRRKYCPKCRR